MTVEIKRLDSQASDFWQELKELQNRDTESDGSVMTRVNNIINAVRTRGDAALLEFTAEFDSLPAESVSQLELPLNRLQEAYDGLSECERNALELAASRIRSYANHQKLESWQYTESDGTLLGQQITALDRAGLYVPGGKAAYPSSVLMNAIPARVAGVEELIMVVPTSALRTIGWRSLKSIQIPPTELGKRRRSRVLPKERRCTGRHVRHQTRFQHALR